MTRLPAAVGEARLRKPNYMLLVGGHLNPSFGLLQRREGEANAFKSRVVALKLFAP